MKRAQKWFLYGSLLVACLIVLAGSGLYVGLKRGISVDSFAFGPVSVSGLEAVLDGRVALDIESLAVAVGAQESPADPALPDLDFDQLRRYISLIGRAAGWFERIAVHTITVGDATGDFRQLDYTQPTALVLGTELFGVSDTALSFVDRQISIPMMGVSQSLNVSVACAVVLYEAQRQRQAAGMYDQCRLDDETLAEQRFEWLHPVLADYCQRHRLQYPALDESGDLAEPMPRA